MYGLQNPEVNADVTLRMVLGASRTVHVACTLSYSATAPFEVSAAFRAGDDVVVWSFARDLLQEGLVRPTGDGDITLFPDRDDAGRDVINLSLTSPTGQALLEADRADIEAFVSEIFSVVPAGSEGRYIDLDLLVLQLLSDDPSIGEFDTERLAAELTLEAEIEAFSAEIDSFDFSAERSRRKDDER